MNIVLITNWKRPHIFQQTIDSLFKNAIDRNAHKLTVVYDGIEVDEVNPIAYNATSIFNDESQGASASRNIGASSIPTYRRQKYVMFSDDDCYYVKGWDLHLEFALRKFGPGVIVSGHEHPFNHPWKRFESPDSTVDATSVLSTVNIAMPWEIWDHVGYWIEPGGPGGSEDVEWCKRAVDHESHFGLAVTVPQVVLHTGLTSSRGEPIVGADMVRERNRELEEVHGIVGKVRYE